MKLAPYLYFDGRCEEAIDFYRNVLGAEVIMKMRFKDSPDQSMTPPGSGEKIMHASLRLGENQFMASDGQCGGKAVFSGISMSLEVPTAADAERVFAALGDGGQVQMPMTETFFSKRFGMVADRFGVSWLLTVTSEQPS